MQFIGRQNKRRNPWDKSHPIFDAHFGHHLTERDLLDTHLKPTSFSPQLSAHFDPPIHIPESEEDVFQQVSIYNDHFKVMVDVSHFEPEEITVKTVDNAIVVDAEHEDRADHLGSISRQFSRKYILPEHIDPLTVTSTLSHGILIIQAPKKESELTGEERAVPISMSLQSHELQPVHITVQ